MMNARDHVKVWIPIALLALAGAPGSTADEGAPCEEFRFVESIGHVCDEANGLLSVYSPEGEFLGTTHGLDAAPSGEALGDVAPNPKKVTCVTGEGSDYYAVLVYAHASNDANDYWGKVDQIRDMANRANAYVNDAGVATGKMVDLKVLCDASGVPIVYSQQLPTQLCCDSFSTIVSDLRSQGFSDVKEHVWVFYDDTSLGGGTGHICYDDVGSAANCNNGNAGVSFFSVNFGWTGVDGAEIMLHELSHNMGAVQDSAPDTTQAGHCWDGLDIMCYNDGGPRGSWYGTGYCPSATVYDCDKDDYFNANPAPGSYLAEHWNIAATYNRYVAFGKPRMDTVSCPASIQVGRTITCTFSATDVDSGSIYYSVNWGDDATFYTGWLTPGTVASMAHSYTPSYVGARTITVTAYDGSLVSDPITTSVTVTPQNAPVMQSLSCPSTVLVGSTFTCTFRATDDSNNVYYAVDWGDGQTLYTGWLVPGVTSSMSHSYPTTGTRVVSVTSTDDGNPQMTSSPWSTSVMASFDMTPPSITLVHPATSRVYRGCQFNDVPSPNVEPTYIRTGCIEATVTDDVTGVASVTAYYGGVSLGTKTSGPYQWIFFVSGAYEIGSASLTAVDNAGNSATASRLVREIG